VCVIGILRKDARLHTPPAPQVNSLHLLRAVRNLRKVRLAALRSPGLCRGRKKDRHTRRLTKTRANDAWLFEI
jgi:hypothetical protein